MLEADAYPHALHRAVHDQRLSSCILDDKMDALLQRDREVSDPEKYTMLLNMVGTNIEYEQTLDTFQTNIAMTDKITIHRGFCMRLPS